MNSQIFAGPRARQVPPTHLGGKASGLLRLEHLDSLNIPAFFVVSSLASVGHLSRAGILEEALRGLHHLQDEDFDLEAFSSRMRERINTSDVSLEVQREITEALPKIGQGPFAVRSSMVGEDSKTQSFAGQLSSFLYLQSAEEVVDALRKCWASAFTTHALKYRNQTFQDGDVPITLPHVAVVIQTMITGEVSGVTFTAHPLTGRRDQVLTNATWGLAEGVVNGACNTDEFVWSTSDGEISHRVAPKDIKVVQAPDKKGTVEVDVDEEKQDRRCLTAKQLRLVSETTSRIADAFGAPQDIEWTIADGKLYILQSRPITVLPVPDNDDGPLTTFDNSNIQESYCGVTTPLTFSFAQEAYASVYEQTMRALRISDEVIDDHRDMLRNMIGLVRGRVYYNINNWYRGLLLLPSFGRNKEDMEAMMGLDVPVDFVEDQVLTLGQKLRRLPGVLVAFTWLLIGFRSLPRAVPRFLGDFDDAYDRVDRESFSSATFSELMDTLQQMRTEMLENWATPIINDFYVMMAMGRLRRLVASAEVENPEEVANNLLSGEEGIESVEPTRVLMRLARDAQKDSALVNVLKQAPPEKALEKIDRDFPDFAAGLYDYIERYGDRVIGELKLETITAREDASFVIHVLRNYLARPDLDPDNLADRERKLRSQAEKTLADNLGFMGNLRSKKIINKARQAVKNRENMRLARTRMFGLFRDAYRALGDRLQEAGKLDDARDIFYLTTGELLAYHEGRAVSAELAPIIEARRAEYAEYEELDLPHHFKTRGPVYHGNRFEGPTTEVFVDPDATILKGTGCYPGRVQAPLRVVMSPADNLDMQEHILTTLRTDPGWAPLFPAAAGILVERGSTLSHSAVVARELGIPAVVGVPGLLATVKDGEEVVLDGAAGTVERFSQLEAPLSAQV